MTLVMPLVWSVQPVSAGGTPFLMRLPRCLCRGLKPAHNSRKSAASARLKSCPDTKHVWENVLLFCGSDGVPLEQDDFGEVAHHELDAVPAGVDVELVGDAARLQQSVEFLRALLK